MKKLVLLLLSLALLEGVQAQFGSPTYFSGTKINKMVETPNGLATIGTFDSLKFTSVNFISDTTIAVKSTAILMPNGKWKSGGYASTNGLTDNVVDYSNIGNETFIIRSLNPVFQKLDTQTNYFIPSGLSMSSAPPGITFHEWGPNKFMFDYAGWINGSSQGTNLIWDRTTNTTTVITSSAGSGYLPINSDATAKTPDGTVVVAGLKNGSTAGFVTMKAPSLQTTEVIPDLPCLKVYKNTLIAESPTSIYIWVRSLSNTENQCCYYNGSSWTVIATVNIVCQGNIHGAAIGNGVLYTAGSFTSFNGTPTQSGIVAYKLATAQVSELGNLPSDLATPPTATHESDAGILYFLNNTLFIVSNGYLTFGKVILHQFNPINLFPLKLTSFSANREKGSVKLSWTTAQEHNTDHFDIERSIDSRNFSPIGTVKAAGQSSNEKEYVFNDYSFIGNTTYYRLTTVDKDGSKTRSLVVKVNGGTEIAVYPNPAHNTVAIRLPEKMNGTIAIINSAGQHVLQQPIITSGATTKMLDVSRLQSGYYVLKIYFGDKTVFTKLVKQ